MLIAKRSLMLDDDKLLLSKMFKNVRKYYLILSRSSEAKEKLGKIFQKISVAERFKQTNRNNYVDTQFLMINDNVLQRQ